MKLLSKKRDYVLLSVFFLFALFLIALLSDEAPSQTYLELKQIPQVDEQDWNDTIQFMQTGLLPGKKPDTVDKLLQLLRDKEINRANELFINSFWNWENVDDENTPCLQELSDKKVLYACYMYLLADKKMVQNYLDKHQALIEQRQQIIPFQSAQFAEKFMTEIDFKYQPMAEELLEHTLASPLAQWKRSLTLLILDTYHSTSFKQSCKDDLISSYSSHLKLMNSINLLYPPVLLLVKESTQLDLFNVLMLSNSEFANCFVFLPPPSAMSYQPLANYLKLTGRIELQVYDEVQEQPKDHSGLQFIRYKWLYKKQKSRNISAEITLQRVQNVKHAYEHPFDVKPRKVNLQQYKWRNWNNLVGAAMLEILKPQIHELVWEYSLLAIKQQLTRAHAALILCQQAGRRNCQSVLEQYPDPFYQVSPTIMEQGKKLGYQFGPRQNNKIVSILMKAP